MAGATVVVHAGALKQVSACELQPLWGRSRQTSMGARNVIDAAITRGCGALSL